MYTAIKGTVYKDGKKYFTAPIEIIEFLVLCLNKREIDMNVNQPTLGETVSGCFCIGPINGEPVCPCKMRHVKVVGGRYILQQDLGPVTQQDEFVRKLKDILLED